MENVVIDGGLDLVHARPAVLAGFIRQCLNYEVGWTRGYTRIDGFERFDGHISPSSTTGWVFEIAKTDVNGTFDVPEGLDWGTGENAELVQIEDPGDNWRFFIVFRQGRNRPVYGDTLTGSKSGASFLIDDILFGSLQTFPEFYATHAEYLASLDNFATILRAEVQPVPGGGTIVGLHYHEDQLYAIRDVVHISIPDGHGGRLQAGMYVYNDIDQVGEVLTADEISNSYHIAAVDSDGFELGLGDVIHVALTARFEDGRGTLVKGTTVTGADTGAEGDIGFIDLRNGSYGSSNASGVVALIEITDTPVPTPPEIFEAEVTGTVSVGAGTAAVLGDETTFVDDLSAGDVILIGTQYCEVDVITDNLNLTLTANHVAGATNVEYSKSTLTELEGTVSVTAGTAAVVGVGTIFTTDLTDGVSVVKIGDEYILVQTVTDDLNLVLASNHVAGATAVTMEVSELTLLTQLGEFNMVSIQFQSRANATAVAVDHDQAEVAAIWKSTDTGWEAADSTRSLRFENGSNNPDTEVAPVNLTKTAFPDYAAQVTFDDDRTDWTGSMASLYQSGGYISGSMLYGGGGFGGDARSETVEISDFKFALLDEDVITGLELTVKGRTYANSDGYTNFTISTKENSSGGRGATFPWDGPLGNPNPWYTEVLGGDGISWTDIPLTPDIVNSADFGFNFSGSTYNQAFIQIDYVQAKLFYTAVPGEKLYLYDSNTSADIGTINVADIVKQTGEWLPAGTPVAPGTAAGYLRLKDWSLVNLPAGVQIWSQPGGTGLFVADVVGDVSTPVLPGSLLLDAEKSRYQMISYNFFASEEKNAIYGCSGAGPAFWYDGTTLDFILTGVDVDKDKPRHLAPHQHRLALGYKWGEVYTSEPGEPTKWDGSLFAGTFGFGDKITGLMPTVGEVLAVFTESATHALSGAPGDDSNPPQQKIINHKVGAIEYTVQNIGNRPIFASFRGIETLDTMQEFGDLFTAPLTYNVSPWLLERLQTAAGLEATDKSVVNSVVVRNKNQYRLFFADGYVMTLTYVGPEKNPQLTIQQYWFNSDRLEYSRCYATASGVTTDGRDRAFFSTELRPESPDPSIKVDGVELDFVYELDRGRSFDGGSIEASFTLTHNFSQQQQTPMLTKRYNVAHLHGSAAGYASIRVARSVNYEDLDEPVLPYEDAYFGALTHPPEEHMKPKYSTMRLTARGFAVSLNVSHESSTEFPHNIQLVTFLDDNPTRPNR